jgi:hypothetical protein
MDLTMGLSGAVRPGPEVRRSQFAGTHSSECSTAFTVDGLR